jgi:hypothetical protein
MRRVTVLPVLLAFLASCGGGETPRDRVTILGSANFLPGPEAPFVPSLAETLVAAAGADDVVLRATGNGEGMAVLCRLPEAVNRMAQTADRGAIEPDLVLMTRAPAAAELEACRRAGIEVGRLRLATYLGGIPNAERSVDGIWMVWDRAQEDRSSVTARVIARAREDRAALIDSGPYGRYFRAGP